MICQIVESAATRPLDVMLDARFGELVVPVELFRCSRMIPREEDVDRTTFDQTQGFFPLTAAAPL